MELRQLRYFVAVARERNFTRAAETLNIAQPPLSRQVRQLEHEVGVPLIEPGSRPLRLTEAGRLLYDQAVQILERIEQMSEMARRLAATGRARVGIGFVASTLYGYLPEVIRRYKAARPAVEVTLHEMTSLEQIIALKDRRIDVGFGRIPHGDPQVTRVLMRKEPLLAAVSVSDPLADRQGPLVLRDLADRPLVVYPKAPRPSYADQVLALFRARDLRPPFVYEVKELQTALGLVAADAAVAVVPASVARLRRDNVLYLPLDEPDALSPIIMSTRHDDTSPEIALILKLIKRMYRDEKIPFGR
ncbi:DNA-binding transcriptional LysR family regulator [Amaricoccus macauensis]|uniref:DNA-binding transcriptional LysR family regulator n=1 Tax=Amaricoccus macauensis TaxID=57001 RepID=A0A840SFA7_9RHOB|nr:LysR substrate-binding domain-containing protein [Amaricoccus macauensis]MBB5220527.1 DNA-binding transcriptional LysR family regulator [Amaricoccus macauensis]